MAYVNYSGAANSMALDAFQQASLLRHFRSNKALSEETAIEMSQLDWIELGFNPENSWWNPFNTRIKALGVRFNSYGKFWLDVDELMAHRKRESEMVTIAVLGIIIITIVILYAAIILA